MTHHKGLVVIVTYEKSVRLKHLLLCILLVVPLRQYIRFLRLHDGICLASEFSGNLDDCLLRVHTLTTVGIIAPQLIVSMDGHPACLYNQGKRIGLLSSSVSIDMEVISPNPGTDESSEKFSLYLSVVLRRRISRVTASISCLMCST